MDAPRRVLIVYSRVGGGHLSAARALAGELEATGRARVRLLDAYLEGGRFPVTLFPSAYARLARQYPRLWWLVFHGSRRGLNPDRLVGPFLRRGLARAMAAEPPDSVVSVLPVVNGVLAELAPRVEVVVTDWDAAHPMWFSPRVSFYSVPSPGIRRQLIARGAAPDCIAEVGIPVRRQFTEVVDRGLVRRRCLEQLDLAADRFTILAMVGAEGSPRSLANITRLVRAELEAQVIVVCGRNQGLLRKLQRVSGRPGFRALGFVEHVADLMRSADVLVTKAGGVTMAEAFAVGVPVVVHDVLAGQETGNLQYALRAQAAVHARSPRRLVELMRDLARHPEQRAALADAGRRLARPAAARDIAAGVLARLGADAAG